MEIRGKRLSDAQSMSMMHDDLPDVPDDFPQKFKVPIQSLIDHIKTATDVDPWAKEMAEELLKEQEPVKPILIPWRTDDDGEPIVLKKQCGKCGWQFFTEKPKYCEECGTPIDWTTS